MTKRIGRREDRAFTLVEILVALALAASIVGLVNFFLSRSIKHNEMEASNLAAIQEMVYIIYNLRMDLRTFAEFPDDKDTIATFDREAKNLKFTVVSGVDDTGRLLYSDVRYYFKNGCVMKDFRELSGNSLGTQKTKKLSQAGKIKEFDVEMIDADGNPVTMPRKPGKPPEFFRMKVTHATNARLEVAINICSTYMIKDSDPANRHWLPCWKLKPVTPVTSILTSIDTIKFSTTGTPAFNHTQAGIKVDDTMMKSDGLGEQPQNIIAVAPDPPKPQGANPGPGTNSGPGQDPGPAQSPGSVQNGPGSGQDPGPAKDPEPNKDKDSDTNKDKDDRSKPKQE